MKITKQQLKQIIKEELSALSEGNFEEAHNDEVCPRCDDSIDRIAD